MNSDPIEALYLEWSGHLPALTEQIAGAGSNRVYYRLTDGDGRTVVACQGTNADENRAFIALSRHFATKGLPVPRVLAVSDDGMCYIQDDLGHTSLFDTIANGRKAGGQYNDEERKLLHEAMRLLPRVQFTGAEGLDFSVCYPQPELDATGIGFDLNYFKYCFLKPSGTEFHELRLEEDFSRLTTDLLSHLEDYAFMYRDFQARNIMVDCRTSDCGPQTKDLRLETKDFRTQRLGLIDFQGGRRGPFYYDLASFLWQASARYPDELRRELLDTYYNEASTLRTLPPREVFNQRLQLFVLFRLVQVLGAYGFRGYFERKQHFIESIPPALESLGKIISQGVASHYPTLEAALMGLIKNIKEPTKEPIKEPTKEPTPPSVGTAALQRSEALAPTALAPMTAPKLTVRIFSFSYKKGIPHDESGNGGGYVFDCRGTNNPGRYEQYKHLTGLDEPVIRFLEDDGEILQFLESVYRLADAHVERYIERGFTSLMFSFGCTGGQHRSVYCAQHLAERLHNKYGITIELNHREQNICASLIKSEK